MSCQLVDDSIIQSAFLPTLLTCPLLNLPFNPAVFSSFLSLSLILHLIKLCKNSLAFRSRKANKRQKTFLCYIFLTRLKFISAEFNRIEMCTRRICCFRDFKEKEKTFLLLFKRHKNPPNINNTMEKPFCVSGFSFLIPLSCTGGKHIFFFSSILLFSLLLCATIYGMIKLEY
jgi:hypothetical protein